MQSGRGKNQRMKGMLPVEPKTLCYSDFGAHQRVVRVVKLGLFMVGRPASTPDQRRNTREVWTRFVS